MDGLSQVRCLGRFLYTQNPFYLVSCGLILYGLQIAIVDGDLQTRSTMLALCMMGYTLLMSLTVVAVVRGCKVWQDARSIFLVVMISQLASSVSFDLLCLASWQTGARLLAGGYVFAILSAEFVIRCTGIRFPAWYRASYYALLLVFYAFPVAGGYSVASNELGFARWSAPLFSVLISAALLLLVPAIRRGAEGLTPNGTPWQWPLYPLSAFVVVIVGAGIRAHAVWMAFGSFRGSVVFEPFLLLPIAFAGLVLTVEFGRRTGRRSLVTNTMLIAPLLLFLGSSQQGITHLAIEPELRHVFGSAFTLACLAIVAFYGYAMMLGIRHARHAVGLSLLAFSLIGDPPGILVGSGLQPWMLMLPAVCWYLVACLFDYRSETTWLTLTSIATATVLRAGIASEEPIIASLMALTTMLAGLLLIGALFESPLAYLGRQVSAGLLTWAGIVLVGWYFVHEPSTKLIVGLAGVSALCLLYGHAVRRTGWLYLCGFQTVCLGVLWTHASGLQIESVGQSYFPLQSGLACFGIAIAITSLKSGGRRRSARRMLRRLFHRYQRGF